MPETVVPRLRVMILALVAVVATACGESAAVSPAFSSPGVSVPPASAPASGAAGASADPGASLSFSPAPSPPSPSPSSGPSIAASPAPSGSGRDLSGVTDLRELLPHSLGGQALTKSLFTGADFAASPAAVSDQMRALLNGLGRDVTDLEMAVATDPTATIDVTVTAFRVRGVQAQSFFEAYLPLITEAFPSARVNETVFGSKTVFDVSLDGSGIGTTFLYPLDDVLFIVTGSNLELVDEAFVLLP